MNKKLLIAAVGAALVAGPMLAAQAATTVYGHFHESLDRYDNGGGTPSTERGLLNSNATRFGIKGDEDLGGGLKSIYQVESGVFEADAGKNTGTGTGSTGFGGQLRNTYLGFADSSWGSVKLGRHDTPVKDISRKLDRFNEEIGDMRVVVGNQIFDARINNMVRYDSPSFSGVKFALLYGTPEVKTEKRTTSGSATWSQGPLYLALGYETNKFSSSTLKDEKDLRLAGQYDITNDLYVFALYDKMSDLSGTSGNDGKAWSLGAGYKMANNLLKFQYSKADKTDKATAVGTSTDDSSKLWVVGVDHNFSKTTKVYVDYAKATNGGAATRNVSSRYAGHGDDNVPTPSAGKSPKALSLGTIINF